jgi:hypothetical protein
MCNKIKKWRFLAHSEISMTYSDTLPSSLIDSNVSMKWKQWKSKELGARSLAHNILGVEGRVGALGWD